jgi:hypothetical protein
MKVPITNGQLLTLATSEQDLKLFLFEAMMQPKVKEFHKQNQFILHRLHESHQALIEKFFERNEDGSVKMTEEDPEKNILGSPIYKLGMTKELFEVEQKEWSLKEKTMEV